MTGTVVVRSAATIAPPNTATGPFADPMAAPTVDPRLGLLAAFAGLALLLAERVIRRRRSST
jgi:hypothetical protein